MERFLKKQGNKHMKIGLIGLGIMGRGMAGQLLQKGFDLTVWNRDISKATPLKEQGAKVAESSAALVADADVVITMLRDDGAVRQTLLGANGILASARPETIFIDMSTVTPMLVNEVATAMREKGCAYLDAPVLGSKDAAAGGKLTVLVGGNAEILEKVRPVLEAVGQNIMHVGANGTSAVLKLANNQAAAVALASVGESLALCEAYSLSLSREQILDLITTTASRVLSMKKEKMVTQDWSTHFALDLMYKDLSQTLGAAGEKHLPMPILAATRETYQRARQSGKGELDFAAVTEQ
jgi:3-hydroxyisobutyrate dehydrogenase